MESLPAQYVKGGSSFSGRTREERLNGLPGEKIQTQPHDEIITNRIGMKVSLCKMQGKNQKAKGRFRLDSL